MNGHLVTLLFFLFSRHLRSSRDRRARVSSAVGISYHPTPWMPTLSSRTNRFIVINLYLRVYTVFAFFYLHSNGSCSMAISLPRPLLPQRSREWINPPGSSVPGSVSHAVAVRCLEGQGCHSQPWASCRTSSEEKKNATPSHQLRFISRLGHACKRQATA